MTTVQATRASRPPRWAAALVAALAAATLAWAPAARAQVEEAQAERLMRQSGLWEQIADLGPQLKRGFEQAAQQQPMGEGAPEALRRLSSATDEAFAAVAVRVTARRELAARLDARHLPALNAWFDSAVGRRVTQLEVASSAAPSDTERRQAEGERLLAAAGPERRALIDALGEASRNAESSASGVLNLLLALQTGLARAAGRTDLPPIDELRTQLEPRRQAMMQAMVPLMRALSAELYAPLSDADLAAYVRLLQSPAGRHLTDAVIASVNRVVTESAEELGRLAAPR